MNKNIDNLKLKYHDFKEGKMTASAYVLYSLCTNHNDKMEGMGSCSTACTMCERCRNRHESYKIDYNTAKGMIKPFPICALCYAFKQCIQWKSLDKKLISNYYFYNFYELKDEDVPFLNFKYFRFEAFGDLNSILQVKNYITIAKNNKHCTFTLFTKNSDIFDKALKLYNIKKPNNMIIVYSTILCNSTSVLSEVQEKYPFVDKVFNVYTEPAAELAHVCYNCEGKKCADCLKCYKKSKKQENNNLFEKLK